MRLALKAYVQCPLPLATLSDINNGEMNQVASAAALSKVDRYVDAHARQCAYARALTHPP